MPGVRRIIQPLHKKSKPIKSPRLKGSGKKAFALMVKWASEGSDVFLEQGRIKYLGRVVRFASDTQDFGHFMFKTSFGVHATILLIGCERITIGGLPGLPPHITLSDPQGEDPPITLSAAEGIRPPASEIQRVTDQFKSWIKTRTVVQVAIGDGTRMTLNNCLVSELSDEMFAFLDEASRVTHILCAKDSSTIEIDVESGKAVVVLTNREANSFVTIRDGIENPEAIFAHFASFSRRIH